MCVCRYKNWYLEAMEGVRDKLLAKSEPGKLSFIGELKSGSQFYAKMVSFL